VSETHSRARARASSQALRFLVKENRRVMQINLRANPHATWRDTRVTDVNRLDLVAVELIACQYVLRLEYPLPPGTRLFRILSLPSPSTPRCIIVASAARRELVIAAAAAIMQGAEGGGIAGKRAWKWKSAPRDD